MSHWALDLGTTNSAVARWEEHEQRPHVLHLDNICREVDGSDPLSAPAVVPSATHLIEQSGVWPAMGRLFKDRIQWGRQAYIGKEALDRNVSRIHPCFVPSVKPYLQHAALEPIARLGKRSFSAREVARTYMRELFAEVERQTGERVRELTVTAPVDAYEAYRAEVAGVLRSVGVRKVNFVDEPVAAAAGYGLTAKGRRKVLVVDFGGGTLDMALVAIDARAVGEGSCTVLAKAGRPIGGNLIDRWLLDLCLERMDYRRPIEDDPFWYRLLLQESRWLKETLFLREVESFYLKPPDDIALHRDPSKSTQYVEVKRSELVELLERRELYRMLRECTDEALGTAGEQPDDIIMVGGSTLLPGVFPHFEERFGRDRVRAWKPFEAVVHGACSLAAADFEPADFIVHAYGFEVYDATTKAKEHTIVVPAGTRFPTREDFWTRQLVPTCALGEPERMFKLVIAEIGQARTGDRSFGWDERGQLHRLEDGKDKLVVPLNGSNPTMGELKPPHRPSDRTPRLQVSFGVDDDRWLIATVRDLKTNKMLMSKEPVVRLL